MKKSLCLFLAVLMAASLFGPMLTGCESDQASVRMVENTVPMDDYPPALEGEAEAASEPHTEPVSAPAAAPVTEAPAPVTEAPAPVTEAPAPATEEPAPAEEKAPAAASAPAQEDGPKVEEPAPADEAAPAPDQEPKATEAPVVDAPEATEEPEPAQVPAADAEEPEDVLAPEATGEPEAAPVSLDEGEPLSLPSEEPEKVTVRLDPDGGTFPLEIDRTRNYIEVEVKDGKLTIKDIAGRAPKKEGYKFLGWFTDKGTAGAEVKFEGDTATLDPEVTALYAHWELLPRTVLLHVVNGGLDGTWKDKSVKNEVSVEVELEGNKLPDVSSIKATRSNGTFLGWYTKAPTEEMKHDKDGGYSYWSTVTVNGEPVAANADVPAGVTILYAVFKDKEAVTEEDERVTFYLDYNGINGMWGHCLTLTRKFDPAQGGYRLSYEDLAVYSLNWMDIGRVFNSMSDLESYWSEKNEAGGFNGYIFKGWAKTPGSKTADVQDGELIHDGDSIYAVWEKGGESSDTFDRTDPAAGPLTGMHLTAKGGSHNSGTMDWSAHATNNGTVIEVSVARSPARATFKEMSWTVSNSLGGSATIKCGMADGHPQTYVLDNVITVTATATTLKVQYTGDKNAVSKAAIRLTVNAEATNQDDNETKIKNSGLPITIYFSHDWGTGTVTKKAAKCEDTTDTQYTCDSCGATYTQSVKKDHFYSEKRVDKEPTCTEPGKQTWYCSNKNEDGSECGAKGGSSSIPALGHHWVKDASVEPVLVDCRHSTFTYKCDRNDCTETETRTEWSYNGDQGHKWGEWYTTKEADFLHNGEQRRYCSVCGNYQTKTVAKLPVFHVDYSGKEYTGFRAGGYNAVSEDIGILSVGANKYFADGDGYAKTGWQAINGQKYYLNTSNGIMTTGWQTIGGQKYYMGSDGVVKTGWQTINGQKYHMDGNGVVGINWQTIDGKKYYMGPDGAMRTGWQTIGGQKYYLGTDGVVQTGWQTIGGQKYYFDGNGAMKTGWQTVSGKKYYLNTSNGIMTTGWQTIGGQKYYLGTDGVVQTGLQTIGGQKYYFAGNGTMTTGWQTVSGKKYYFNTANGAVQTGWQTIGGQKYYMGSDGAVQTGWQTIGGKKYHMDGNGVVGINWQTVDGKKYYMGSDGAVRTGVQTIDGKRYLFDGNGCAAAGVAKVSGKIYVFGSNGAQITGKGWQTVNGKKYYLGSDGSCMTGQQTISKKKYYFDGNGVMVTGGVKIGSKVYVFKADGTQQTGKGWKTISGKKYYLNSNGSCKTGWQTISGKKYYFGSDGAMMKGWQTISGKRYYFKSNGQMVKGLQTIGGQKYYFSSKGVMKTNGWQTVSGKKYYFGSDGAAVKGWQTIGGKRYYFKSNCQMATGLQTIGGKKYYFSSKGVLKVNGWQKVSGKKYYFGSDGAALKGWQIIGGKQYYFKSNCQMATGKVKIDGKTYKFGSNGVLKT